MEPSQKVIVPGYSGKGLRVAAGSLIRITDVEGCQVGDLFALPQADPREYLCTARTRALNARLFPAVGQQFVTNEYRPILTFVADHSPGIHDTLYMTCDPGTYRRYGLQGHPNCYENYLKAAKELGIATGYVPGPVNLFQNTPVQPDGTIKVGRSPTKAGDYVDLRAEMDVYLILTACSFDVTPDFIGGKSTPLQIDVFG